MALGIKMGGGGIKVLVDGEKLKAKELDLRMDYVKADNIDISYGTRIQSMDYYNGYIYYNESYEKQIYKVKTGEKTLIGENVGFNSMVAVCVYKNKLYVSYSWEIYMIDLSTGTKSYYDASKTLKALCEIKGTLYAFSSENKVYSVAENGELTDLNIKMPSTMNNQRIGIANKHSDKYIIFTSTGGKPVYRFNGSSFTQVATNAPDIQDLHAYVYPYIVEYNNILYGVFSSSNTNYQLYIYKNETWLRLKELSRKSATSIMNVNRLGLCDSEERTTQYVDLIGKTSESV